MFGERSERCTTKERWLHSETRGWEYYAVGMLQPTLNRESQDGRNREERRKYEALERKPQTTSSKSGSLCLPTRQQPKTCLVKNSDGSARSPDTSASLWGGLKI